MFVYPAMASAVFGLFVGSFLNVIIYRLKSGESIAYKRSHCRHCGKILAWYELVPVVSFLIQGGRCRACSKRISLQYPAVEIVTALLFLQIFNFQFSMFGGSQAILNEFSIFNFQLIFSSLFLAFILSGLLVIFIYDLKHYLISDKILFPLIAATLVYRFLGLFNLNLFGTWKFEAVHYEAFLNPALAAVFAASFFLALFVVSRGFWMGFGDVKLAFFMGLFLGYPNIIVALFLAFLSGAIIGLSAIVLGKKTLKSQIPFAPFLIAGILAVFFWGGAITDWYLHLFI